MKKSKHYTREFRNDDPTTHLTDVEQQKNMLLDTMIDAAKAKKIILVLISIWDDYNI